MKIDLQVEGSEVHLDLGIIGAVYDEIPSHMEVVERFIRSGIKHIAKHQQPSQPKVGHKYQGPLNTWALLMAAAELLRANEEFYRRLRDSEAETRCHRACALLIPRIEALGESLGTVAGVSAPRRAPR